MMIIQINTLNELYTLENVLDISFATGDSFYAPGWSMICDFKKRKIDEASFKKKYLSLMKIRFKNPRMGWKVKKFLEQEIIILCVSKGELHNVWLKEFIEKL